ncbi:MAG: transcriptional regulator [Bacteroidota bacterium]|nr:transcriptional regulator [Bacteroidota bacterium]
MEFIVKPVAFVKNSRKEIEDDNWSAVTSEIHLSEEIPEETLSGITDFSHLEILYVFHQLQPGNVLLKTEHPRENPAFPKVGIFAQRKKNRPNLIGLTIVELVKAEGRKLTVKNLDAIDGTPVIDIKPVMKEFLPQGEVKQPQWSAELMKNYW